MNIGRIPPEGGGGGDIPLGAEKRRWHHDRASLMFSGYGVPPVRRSPRCAWGWSVAWDAGLQQDALVATQRRNGRAFSSLTARGGGLPVGVITGDEDFLVLDAQWSRSGKHHAGIIYLPPDRKDAIGTIVAYVVFLHQAIAAGAADLVTDIYNQVIRIERI